MVKQQKQLYEFGAFELDPAERRLRRGSEVIPLTPKALDVLLLLVGQGGHAVKKEEFFQRIWPGSFVEEKNLADNISLLRKALGDDPRNPAYIETVPRYGYRFVGEVREILGGGEEIIALERSRASILLEEEDAEGKAHAPGPLPAADSGPEQHLAPSARRRRPALIAALALAAAAALALGAYLFLRSRADRAQAQAQPVSTVAVLPFKPLVAEGADAALELGMTDALISRLSNIRRLTVRPTSSVIKFAGEGQDLKAVASALGVDVILDGRVHRAGDRIRLSVQLVRASDGSPVWAETFDAKFTDIFAVQDAISEKVASALALKLTGEERKGLSRRYTDNTEAYQLYLKGHEIWSTFNPPKLQASINYYNEALKIDPNYALAYSGIANAYTLIGLYGPLTPLEAMPRAMEAARKALELDENLAEAHVSLGALKLMYEWDWPGAERELRRAIELDPNSTDAHNLYAYYLQVTGRMDEAVAEIKRAKELAPQWFIPNRDYLLSLFSARRYEEAVAESRKVASLEPDDYFAHNVLGLALTKLGRYEEAEAELRLATDRPGRKPPERALAALGYLYGVTGKKDEAMKVIDRLKQTPSARTSLYVAEVYAGMGDHGRAFEWLDKAYSERSPFLREASFSPEFDGLRSDPRFAQLLRRMNL